MHQGTRSTLVQAMDCRLFSAKPSPELMLTYCQLNPKEQTSVKFKSKFKIYDSWECILIYLLLNDGHFVRGRWVKVFEQLWNQQDIHSQMQTIINILRLRQNRWNFADNSFKGIFCNENCCIFIRTSLKFVPDGSVFQHCFRWWLSTGQATRHYLNQ